MAKEVTDYLLRAPAWTSGSIAAQVVHRGDQGARLARAMDDEEFAPKVVADLGTTLDGATKIVST